MAKYTPPGGNRNKKVKTHKSTATMKSVGTKADQDRMRKGVATVALAAFPVARVSSAVGKAIARSAAKKYAAKPAGKVTKSVVQGRNANVTQTPPKRTGAGPNSPVRGTRVDIETKTRGRSPLQQASASEGRKGATKRAVRIARASGIATGVVGTHAYYANKKQANKGKRGK